jgi:hypothetical protein
MLGIFFLGYEKFHFLVLNLDVAVIFWYSFLEQMAYICHYVWSFPLTLFHPG